jgi:hypothetical protein
MGLDKGREVIKCSHPEANLLLQRKQCDRLLILHHVRSSFHQDELARGRFTGDYQGVLVSFE